MRLKFAVPLVCSTATLLFASVSHADMYTEVGDAGDLTTTAQVTSAPLGLATSLTSIAGGTTQTNAIADGDMFEIYIATGLATAFTASTTAFAAGANDFDDQLFLFNSAGVGIAANDDSSSGGEEASLTIAAGANLTPGDYFLAVEGSGRYPVDASGNLIFPNYTDGTTDPSGTYGTNAGAGALAGYTGNTNEAGKYVIAITGAQFAVSSVVPEPSSIAALATGLGGLVLVLRCRRAR